MAIPMDWGAIHKAVTDGRAVGEDGAVTHPHVGSGGGHDENYNATDGRHNKADHQGWPSIDHHSGPVSDTDFGNTTGSFPDGPGVWRQT